MNPGTRRAKKKTFSTHQRAIPLITLLLLLAVTLTMSIGFTQNVKINNNDANAYTTADLACTWENSSDATTVNITWYKNGVYNTSSAYNVPLPQNDTLSASLTTRDQTWTCNVTLGNGAQNASQADDIVIENSGPTTPIIYYGGVDQGSAMTIIEDQNYTLDVNSTDADNDRLTYYFFDGKFCTVTDAVTGTVNCLPTHAYLENATGGENPSVNEDVEFWVHDNSSLHTKAARNIVTFTINAVNDDPTLTIPTQTTAVNETFNQTFNATDEESDYPLNATIDTTLTSANITNNVNVSVEGSATVRVTYDSNPTNYSHIGNHTVTINLTDARGASTLVTFTLTITKVNRHPYFTTLGPWNYSSSQNKTYVIVQGNNLTINVSANDFDTGDRNETLNYSDDTSLFNITMVNTTASATSDALGQINITATNDNVGNYTVTLTVTDDDGLMNTTTINVTIQNANDAPVIYNQSYNSSNTFDNVNVTHLIAYIDAPFYYWVNYTDPDLQYGETLNFSDNTSTFNITNNGEINCTPTGLPRNETINLTLADDQGLYDNRTILFEIRNNTRPYFNATIPWLNCSEGVQCMLNLSAYADDDDLGDSIATFAATPNTTIPSFNLNTTNGLVSFTPQQSEIGHYTVTVTITDQRGATNTTTFNLTINNTPDYPVWLTYDFSNETIVTTHAFSFTLNASDQDLLLENTTENLTFTTNESWITINVTSIVNEVVTATLSFTANTSQGGNHTIQLNVTDATNRTNSTNLTFYIYNDTEAPNITAVTPWGNGTNDTLALTWLNTTGSALLWEAVTLPENTTSLFFQANATDDTTATANLTYQWLYDGSIVGTTKNYTRNFSFFSAGTHNVSVIVNDTRYENTTWTWNLTVTNVNRPPTLENNLTANLSIDSTTTHTDYFKRTNALNRFFDPDDDTDESGLVDGNETQNLTYTSTTCNVAAITFVNDSLKLTPQVVGSCLVRFTATDDDGEAVTSNLVTITVTDVPTGDTEIIQGSSGGGGGGAASTTTLMPYEIETETPHPLTIIAPKLVMLNESKSITIPIRIQNNWTTSLKGVLLSAQTNHTNLTMNFDTDYIESVGVNESVDVALTVKDYRLGENFEVVVKAEVADPLFTDTALILFNSIEERTEGESAQLKVTFAQDLLSQHAECQELNELLDKAKGELGRGQTKTAAETLDAAINGCKYLVSQVKSAQQQPDVFRTPFFTLDEETLQPLAYVALPLVLVIAAFGLLYYHHKTKDEYDY